MSVKVKRPRDPKAIRALIRERQRNVTKLEKVLALPLPAQDRKHLQLRLKGEKANLISWQDYLEKCK